MSMRITIYPFILTALLFMAGCRGFVNPFLSETALAKVDDRELYMSDIEDMFSAGITPADSIKILEAYVDSWVKKQLKVIEAEQRLKGQKEQIEQMVEDYRNSLLNFKLDQYHVDNKLDTVFTTQDIDNYYKKNRAEFVLDRTIVKGMIIKFPESYRQKARLKELMGSAREIDKQDFIDICLKNNFELIEFNKWTDFDEFIASLPTIKGRKYDSMSETRGVQEMADAQKRYFVLITEVKSAGDHAPVERVRNIIDRVLFNQHKQEIIHSYEDSIYRSAVEQSRIEININ